MRNGITNNNASPKPQHSPGYLSSQHNHAGNANVTISPSPSQDGTVQSNAGCTAAERVVAGQQQQTLYSSALSSINASSLQTSTQPSLQRLTHLPSSSSSLPIQQQSMVGPSHSPSSYGVQQHASTTSLANAFQNTVSKLVTGSPALQQRGGHDSHTGISPTAVSRQGPVMSGVGLSEDHTQGHDTAENDTRGDGYRMEERSEEDVLRENLLIPPSDEGDGEEGTQDRRGSDEEGWCGGLEATHASQEYASSVAGSRIDDRDRDDELQSDQSPKVSARSNSEQNQLQREIVYPENKQYNNNNKVEHYSSSPPHDENNRVRLERDFGDDDGEEEPVEGMCGQGYMEEGVESCSGEVAEGMSVGEPGSQRQQHQQQQQQQQQAYQQQQQHQQQHAGAQQQLQPGSPRQQQYQLQQSSQQQPAGQFQRGQQQPQQQQSLQTHQQQPYQNYQQQQRQNQHSYSIYNGYNNSSSSSSSSSVGGGPPRASLPPLRSVAQKQ
eukprot:GHVQ01018125.1.p1 GENE.GHVQ01018125.1~~GHVQ01018125.1.p1  ORF type:complete len:495 (-),score=161.08 GHVQ01018125.1:422-1906(-)